ncbi:MAG: Asp/Glu/hydantoin racemase [Anaerolineae bacterium]|nr:Asp/Glu/hydantoin racemase [Anaerolineae bacterium]
MPKRVGMLHTSFVFIQVETMINDLFREILPDVEVLHFVDSEVLAAVMRAGKVTPEAVRRLTFLAQAAQAAGVDAIFSACSSLGPAADVAALFVDRPLIKIDEAMAREAVSRAARIGVLATVPTTLGPTTDLIRRKAADVGKTVEVFPRLSEGAFEALMGGDKQRHDRMVLEGALDLAPQVEILTLAQASMTRLAPWLSQETGLEVLSSPRLGIEHLRDVLEQMGS